MPQNATGFSDHNHSACVRSGLSAAEATCATEGLKMTPVRRRVLEILLEAHEALGAYDVLARLAEEGLGSKPPVAYRALGFLVENGFVHRIEKLNAFVACALPGSDHTPAFLICRSCKSVAEATEISMGLRQSARENGFIVEHTIIEAEGLCPVCQDAA